MITTTRVLYQLLLILKQQKPKTMRTQSSVTFHPDVDTNNLIMRRLNHFGIRANKKTNDFIRIMGIYVVLHSRNISNNYSTTLPHILKNQNNDNKTNSYIFNFD